MIGTWLTNRRRRRLMAEPFPTAWEKYLKDNVGVIPRLSTTERNKLFDVTRVLVAEKNWEGCGGFVITDEVRVTIAAQAALLLLGLEHDYYSRCLSILVYPAAYEAPTDPHSFADNTGTDPRLGEAWYRGPTIITWETALEESRNWTNGRNVVLHEFAHQLDFLDGVIDGTPVLRNREQGQRWHDVMTAEFNKLKSNSEQGRATVIDEYGATNPSEFFAVTTECFFTQPHRLQDRHPLLFDVLREYYGQDPRAWFANDCV